SRRQWLFLLSCVVFAGMTAATIRGGWHALRHSTLRRWLILLLLGSLFFGYGAMIVAGRLNLLPGNKEALARNSYYTYIALLFFLSGVFALWLQALPGRAARATYSLIGIGLIVLGSAGAFTVHKTAVSCRKWCRPVFEANQR